MENTLRFGDEILIRYSGYGKKKGTMAQGSEGTSTTADLNLGCIVGMGYTWNSQLSFMDEGVYFQSPRSYKGDDIPKMGSGPVPALTGPPNMLNFRDALFVITPKLNFEFHQDYKEGLAKFEQMRYASDELSTKNEEMKK